MRFNHGWPVKRLQDVVEILDHRRVPVKASERALRAGTVPYYGATGLAGTIDEPIFDEPLVLLGEDGAPFLDPYKPKAYLIDGPAWVNNHAHVLRAGPLLNRKFIRYYLDYFDYRGFANGTTRLKLTQAAMKAIPVPVPSLQHQRQIVDILEDHISRLDAAASYLDAATRRSEMYVACHASRARSGTELPLDEIAVIQGGIQKQQRRAPGEHAFPFLRVANVTANGLDLQEIHKIELFGAELDRLRLRKGDLLVVEGNGSPSQIGRAAMWDGSIEDCVHQNHLIRVRPKHMLLPEYLEAVWNSPENRRTLTAVSSSSSGLHTLSVGKLKRLRLPVPSLAEQEKVASRLIDARASRARLVHQLAAEMARTRQLRRAVFAAAFSGELTGTNTDIGRLEELAGV
ncbi:hypothetical protein GCM10023258_30240 [Terrabacter aeriphilus]|uniref:Type I restriction modification DNA specificity domain-containing protein n=1 Tax=Terrabacter aeriphilus TaxID=515662 RepID=A0ABP9JGX2_9MICO